MTTRALKEILSGVVPLPEGLGEKQIRGLQYDSRKVQTGELFFAIEGFESDGHTFLPQARQKGAAAAVVQRKTAGLDLPQIVVPDSREAMALAARAWHREELDKLQLIAVTGTNGKTSVSFLLRGLLEAHGISCGLSGTIAYWVGDKKIDAWNTTPEAIDLYAMLAEMYRRGNRAVVLEVSSHAMALKRVAGLKFDLALFTNLSRDHLDFHPDMEDYFHHKQALFKQLKPDGRAVINRDDRWGEKLWNGFSKEKWGFGRREDADVRLVRAELSARGIDMRIAVRGDEFDVHSMLVGGFNVENVNAALAAGVALGIPVGTLQRAMARQKAIPGRLESYPLKSGATALIDYAHTPDALEKALQAAREITRNRLWVVFGCGGDRDRGKRPLMARVAERQADHTVVTDDNPRTEDPRQIIDDIMAGLERAEAVTVINDRKEAIRHALTHAAEGDVVLIAGKGHENYQIIGKEKVPFDEVAIIKESVSHA